MAESKRERCRTALRSLSPDEIGPYLNEHSGLPGPRSDLELLAAFGDVAPEDLIRRFADDTDEYLRCCGTAALGRLIVEHPADGALRDLLTARAADPLWRVREGAAMAAQRVGDTELELMLELVRRWVADDDPLVVRAAIASICEPRLLVEPELAAAALDTCRRATEFLAALPPEGRREADVRVLRKALGYCWSVAVAADPARGLPVFEQLGRSGDPDIGWVVRENLKKKRLQALLG